MAANGARQKRADEEEKVSQDMITCLHLRQKYAERLPNATPLAVEQRPGLEALGFENGVVTCAGPVAASLPKLPTYVEFDRDLRCLWEVVKGKEHSTVCHRRISLLEHKWDGYALAFSDLDNEDMTELRSDWHTAKKVDNHIHASAGMTTRELLHFMQGKIKKDHDRVVLKGKKLKEIVCEALNLPAEVASSETPEQLANRMTLLNLRTSAGKQLYRRFDNFNEKYNPLGSRDLRSVFIKTDNDINGEYFGELVHVIIDSLRRNDTYAEMRLSVYGEHRDEWDKLAKWMKAHKLHTSEVTDRNPWMIQIPRIYPIFKKKGSVNNFAETLENIFMPLLETVFDPTSHQDLADVLHTITGIDSVDDESVFDTLTAHRTQVDKSGCGDSITIAMLANPQNWNSENNPPYSYHAYFLQANIKRFNTLSALMGRSWRLKYRPHCGEWGETHHLATSFLVADGINHGIKLMDSPVLQYLYYIAQIGMSVSPTSNNAIFLRLSSSPFAKFFRRGLNCTLSTDDPLIFHHTVEPLLEEYTVARITWDLSNCDLAEIAANSVRQSGFSQEWRAAALGEGFDDTAPYQGWDPLRCSVPLRRLQFRAESLAAELAWLRGVEHRELERMPSFGRHVAQDGEICKSYRTTDWKDSVTARVPAGTVEHLRILDADVDLIRGSIHGLETSFDPPSRR